MSAGWRAAGLGSRSDQQSCNSLLVGRGGGEPAGDAVFGIRADQGGAVDRAAGGPATSMGSLKIHPQMVAMATTLHEARPTMSAARRSALWVPSRR